MKPKGTAKPPGSGRKKGTTNKAIKALREEAKQVCERLGCNPIEGLAIIAKNKKNPVELRARCFGMLAEYVYPKLNRQEHTGLGGGPIKHENVGTDLAKLSVEELRQLRALKEKASVESGEKL